MALEDDNIRLRDRNKVYLNDLFHILDLAGTLMNKAEPSDSDPTPFNEFKKYSVAERDPETNKVK